MQIMHCRWLQVSVLLVIILVQYPATCKLFNESKLTVTSSSTSLTPASTPSSTVQTILPLSPSSATPSPTQVLSIVQQGCLFLNASNVTFTFDSSDFITTNLSHLSLLFKNYTDVVEGCDHKKSRKFTRKYHESNTSTEVKFWFKFSFDYLAEDDIWTLTNLDSGNSTNGNSSFDYGDCGYDLQVPIDMSYHCPKFVCTGHERVSKTGSTIIIQDFLVDAYLKLREKNPSNVFHQCYTAESSSKNNEAFLIVGLVIGITLTVAVLIIVGSFVYKRYRYGPYNLLD